MPALFKELCFMAGDLNTLAGTIQESSDRVETWKRYVHIANLITTVTGKTFNEEDDFYLSVIEDIRGTCLLIRAYRGKENEITVLTGLLDKIFENVEKLFASDPASTSHVKTRDLREAFV